MNGVQIQRQLKLEMRHMACCILYTDVRWCKVKQCTGFSSQTPVQVLNLGDSDSPQRNSSIPPSSWSAQFWPSSCGPAACSSSRGSQTRWRPDGNPPSCTSWTTERCPLQGLSMPCSPGRGLDRGSEDWVSIHYDLAWLNLFALNEPGWLPNAPRAAGSATQDVIYLSVTILVASSKNAALNSACQGKRKVTVI